MHYVYILAAHPHGALYVGYTNDIRRRIEQHRSGTANSHTKKYSIHTLVYFESHDRIDDALAREKKLKRWRRKWKDELIAAVNPEWRDISTDIPI